MSKIKTLFDQVVCENVQTVLRRMKRSRTAGLYSINSIEKYTSRYYFGINQ